MNVQKVYLSLRQVRRQNKDIFSNFFDMKVYCMFSLEPPDRGHSNKYNNIPFSRQKGNHSKLS